jgi:capsid protein
VTRRQQSKNAAWLRRPNTDVRARRMTERRMAILRLIAADPARRWEDYGRDLGVTGPAAWASAQRLVRDGWLVAVRGAGRHHRYRVNLERFAQCPCCGQEMTR